MERDQRELLGRILAIVLNHEDDPLTIWRRHGEVPPEEAVGVLDETSVVLLDRPARRYQLLAGHKPDLDQVFVLDESDPRSMVVQRYRYRPALHAAEHRGRPAGPRLTGREGNGS